MSKYLLGFFLCLCLSCTTTQRLQNPTTVIEDTQVRTVLQKAFVAMGGLSKWKAVNAIHFKKKTVLYLASGAVEKSVFQQHDYYNRPTQKVNISWDQDGIANRLQFEEGQAEKWIDGKIDKTANSLALKNSIMASTFVIGIPFKLLDEGTQLSYEGISTLLNGKSVHVVKAVYNAANYTNHTKSDTWWHYFDEKTYEQVGYMVRLGDHNSYVENLSFEKVGGFLFTKTRESWRVDDAGNKLYLRAAYEYGDFEVE